MCVSPSFCFRTSNAFLVWIFLCCAFPSKCWYYGYFWEICRLHLLRQTLPQLSNRSCAKFILTESYSLKCHSSAEDSTSDISYWDSHIITVTYCALTQCFQITGDTLQNTSHVTETPYVFPSGAVFFNAVSEKGFVTLWAICELRAPWIRSNVKSHVNTSFAQPELLPYFFPSFVYIAEVFILEITCEPTVHWDYTGSDWNLHTGTIVLQEQVPAS